MSEPSTATGDAAPGPGSEPGLAQRIAGILRQMIANGDLPPGARLVESRVATEIGVGRAPIREAARLLESEGLVKFIASRGFFVRQITVRELEEMFELRICIERYTAAAAVGQAARLREPLTQALERIQDAARRGAAKEQVVADFDFHRLIVAASNNRRLLQFFDKVTVELRMIFNLVDERSKDMQSIADSHVPLLEALLSRDAQRAADAMDTHLHLAWDETLINLRREMDQPITPVRRRSP